VIGARVETTLGTRRLSAVELGGVNVNGVPTDAQADLHRAVAAHVAFERHVLKPGFHLIGARVETTWVPGAFQLRAAMGRRESTRAGGGTVDVAAVL
jgi:hypothetical protein